MGEQTDGRRKRLLSRVKHPKQPVDLDAPLPPLPVTNATVTESPPRKKGIGSVRFRKKVKPSAEPVNLRSNKGSELSLSESVDIDISATALNEPDISSEDSVFVPLDRFAVRRGMTHHPYPRQDAPYMQAYDRTLMDNDRFFETLLRRLNPNHSPSFLDFEQDQPRGILDLGCGLGLWAMEAAAFWPNSFVIGFDIVHPARLNSDAAIPPNLQWKQGNFVKYKLPFPKETFDLVRMANLSLCVPADRWVHLFSEVSRVLAPGGRLELIDDQMQFPYSKKTLQHPPAPQIIPRSIRSSSFLDDDTPQSGDAMKPDGEESDDDFKSTKSRFSTLIEPDPIPPGVPFDPVKDWNSKIDISASMEHAFESMLTCKFNVIPRPREHIQDALQHVFGRYNLHKEKDFWCFLAPPSDKDSDNASVGSSESGSSGASGGVKKVGKDLVQWVTTDKSKKDKKDKDRKKGDRSSGESLSSFTQVPETISAKAAGRLGIVPVTPRQLPSGQSPGLIVNLQTFIPLSAFELEMHACKHIHTLLGCKAAIHEYISEAHRDSKSPVPESAIDDLLWEYECFRRKRFHWPAETPEYHLDSPAVETPTPHRHSSDGPWRQRALSTSSPLKAGMYSPADLDLVRSIQVFSAKKANDDFFPLA
ncbi:hypothetical protein SCLCIDRAFT_101937 [Scleroderma citrinum Foug A]|uniref:Methyltransferase domain-containing protein n=1 Tax=Scleroderma citrinum Foug A TaxID=1036808 RepID=A0A0C3A8M7_9AGAM|nr:hypothetical protein SCLCIDRAFT_101937 [Scleroderma citrinum Foug A]